MRSANTRVTGCFFQSESPRSPWLTPTTKAAYCSQIGRSSFIAFSIAARRSGVPRGPSMAVTGSPGTRRTRKNVKSVIMKSTGTM